MYSYVPEQEDLEILQQSIRPTYVKIDLLNKDFQTVYTLDGNLIDDNFSCDGEAKVRRTYNCQLQVDSSKFNVGRDKFIWLDRYLKVYYGILNIKTQDVKYYLIGTFKFVNMSYSLNSTSFTLSLDCSDLMSILNDTLGGNIIDKTLKIEAGQKITESVVGVLKDAKIKKHNIQTSNIEIPYDLEWSSNTTYEDILTTICELYERWEYFFDKEGTFIWRKKSESFDEDVVLDTSVISTLVISEQVEDTFSKVYNATLVLGTDLDMNNKDRYSENVVFNIDTYNVNFEHISTYSDIDNYDRFFLNLSDNGGTYININNLGKIPIYDGNNKRIGTDRLSANKTYAFNFRRTIDSRQELNFVLLGVHQAKGYYEEWDKNIPYSIPNVGYTIVNKQEFPNLYCDELCYNQAEYITYNSTAKQDTLTLNTIIIPFLEPSKKIRYSPISYVNNIEIEWVIKKISWSSLKGTMSINMYRFLPSLKKKFK